MLNLTITDTKDFVKKLLIEETFDTFLLVEANVRGAVSYHISGHINKDFYDTDAYEELSSKEYITWKHTREHVFNVIKGRNMPLGFKIVFILSEANIQRIIDKNNLKLTLSDIANLSLTISFDGEHIRITSLASMNTFTLDKTLENLWEANLKAFFKAANINYTED